MKLLTYKRALKLFKESSILFKGQNVHRGCRRAFRGTTVIITIKRNDNLKHQIRATNKRSSLILDVIIQNGCRTLTIEIRKCFRLQMT